MDFKEYSMVNLKQRSNSFRQEAAGIDEQKYGTGLADIVGERGCPADTGPTDRALGTQAPPEGCWCMLKDLGAGSGSRRYYHLTRESLPEQ